MASVNVKRNESIGSALRRFKKKVQKENILKDVRKNAYYTKPGDKRRAKQARAEKRRRKKRRRREKRYRERIEKRKRLK